MRGVPWGIFVDMLLDRFGREQKELLICQLFHIRQSGSTTDYVESFAELMDQLTTYGHVTEPVYYAMHFVDGLRKEIWVDVSLHRLVDFDTATSLALLQEDISANHKFRRHESPGALELMTRSQLPLPPPPRNDKVAPANSTEELKLSEGKLTEERDGRVASLSEIKGLMYVVC